MKTLLELYILLLEDFKNRYHDNKINGFICHSMDSLNISQEEYNLLKTNFIEQRPSKKKHISFYQDKLYCNSNNKKNPKLAYKLRINFINKIITDLN